jgi:signal transduction histidine kinase
VELTFSLDQRLPEALEAAAYYFVSEAVTNVVKHADATSALVDVSLDGDAAIVSVTDDGVGGVDAGRGSGITGLRDRVESLEGHLTVVSHRGSGTQLRAEFPLTVDG